MKYLKIALVVLLLGFVVYKSHKPQKIATNTVKVQEVEAHQAGHEPKQEVIEYVTQNEFLVLANRVLALENKPMTSIPSQSTDRLSQTTNPSTSQIMKSGTASITLSTSESTGVSGSTTINVDDFNGSYRIPEVDVALTQLEGGSGVWNKTPMPFTQINTNGNPALSGYYTISYSTNEADTRHFNKIYITVNLYSRTASLNTIYFIDYIVRSELWPSE